LGIRTRRKKKDGKTDGHTVDNKNLCCALVVSRYSKEVDVVLSECHDRLVSGRVCSRDLYCLIGGISGEVWLLHVDPRYRRRLGGFEGTHIKGKELSLGICIEDVGVMVENGGKV